MGKHSQAMIARQIRRQAHNELAAVSSAINSASEEEGEFSKRERLIKDLLEEAGYTFSEDPIPLNFLKEGAREGIQFSVARLLYQKESQSLPWHPWMQGKTLESAYKLLKELKVPSWARYIKDATLKSFGPPSTEGMIKRDGSPNKDLAQLLKKFSPVNKQGLKQEFSEARQNLIERLRTHFKGKVKLPNWTFQEFVNEMATSIKTSSPGLPYSGMNWLDQSPIDPDKTIAHHVYEDGKALIAMEEKPPQLFIQGARWTGDGGIEEGQQRLVQQDSAAYKLPGHLLAKPFKDYIQSRPGSGQRGIQEASRHIKNMMNGEVSDKEYNPSLTPQFFVDWDISQWDAAMITETVSEFFFDIIELALDLDDDHTRSVFETVKKGFDNRYLLTHLGWIRPRMWPSGHSCTTIMAFIIHEFIVELIEIRHRRELKSPLIVDFGLQGDDLWACLSTWSDETEALIKDTYARFNCLVKGQIRISAISDDDCHLVFLNEAVSKNPERDNFIFPRWNFFMAESQSDLLSYASLDRNLRMEIESLVAHPSPKELRFASFASKFDRLVNQPFYNFLLKKVWKGKNFFLPSWVGERVLPNSPTRLLLQELEHEIGINQPDSITCALDREEETWLTSTELAELTSALMIASELQTAKPEIRRLIKVSRPLFKPWRSATRVLEALNEDDLRGTTGLVQTLAVALDRGYSEIKSAQAYRESLIIASSSATQTQKESAAMIVKEDLIPVVKTTLAKAIFALHEVNPHELLQRSSKLLLNIAQSEEWANLTQEQRKIVKSAYKKCFLTDLPSPDSGSDLVT